MNNRDRATPIALPRDPPIAEAIGDGCLAAPIAFKAFRHFRFGGFNIEAVEELGIEQPPITDIGFIGDIECFRVSF